MKVNSGTVFIEKRNAKYSELIDILKKNKSGELEKFVARIAKTSGVKSNVKSAKIEKTSNGAFIKYADDSYERFEDTTEEDIEYHINLQNYIDPEYADIVDKIMNSGDVPDTSTLNKAVFLGDVKNVNKMVDMGVEPDADTLNKALVSENMEMIDMVLGWGLEPDEKTLNIAVDTSNVTILNKIIDMGATPTDKALWDALMVRDHHPEILETLLDSFYEYYKNTELYKEYASYMDKSIDENEDYLAEV